MKIEKNSNKIPALINYIERIEAEQINFRKFIIKIHKGNYYIESAIISLEPDGAVNSSHKEYAPTDKEQEAIIEGFKGVKFPKQIKANQANVRELKKKLNKNSTLYEFYSFNRKSVIMVQERRENKNGSKNYIPWTLFDDGIWRALEPDSGLPLWKPNKDRNKTKIMIHEGAKAAKFVDELVNLSKNKKALANHPFGENFKQYEHWGLVGGALAPHRTNYKDLVKIKATETIYVCDNDAPGKSALQKVSKLYGQTLQGIKFDHTWPVSFDFADEVPENKFDDQGIYNGVSFESLLTPATWATSEIKKSGAGRKQYKLSSYFEKEWSHSVTPDCYVYNKHPNHLYNEHAFNDICAPFSDVDNTARLFKKEDSIKARAISYNPSIKPGIYIPKDDLGVTCINTHCPGLIKPVKGSVVPFIEYMEHLFPIEEDRNNVMRWIFTIMAKPEIKMNYGVLLISEMQGVGKTTLGEGIITPIVGKYNVSFPSETEIVDSQFNDWAAHKRLAIVNEIYAGNSDKAYNKLKSIITDRTITINKKFQAGYVIENWLHMLASSNSMRSLKLDNDDRRWLVPKVTENRKPPEFWKEFYWWLDRKQGVEKIYNYALEFVSKNGHVANGDHAPTSDFKKQVIVETLGQDSAAVVDLLESIKQRVKGETVIISDQDISDFIRNRNYEGKTNAKILRPLTIRKLAKNNGWHVCDFSTNYWPEAGIDMRSTKFITNDISLINVDFKEAGLDNLAIKKVDELIGF